MSNSYSGFFMTLAAAFDQAQEAKVAQTPLLDRVKRDFKPVVAAPFSIIQPNIANSTLTATNVGGGGVTYGSVVANPVTITLNQHPAYPFTIPDYDAARAASPEELREMFVDEAVKRVCEYVDQQLAALITLTNFNSYGPVLGVGNTVSLPYMASAWQTLAANKVPVRDFNNFFLSVHPTVFANQAQDPNWASQSNVGYLIAQEVHRMALLGQQWGAWCDFDQYMPSVSLTPPSAAPTAAATGGGSSGGSLAAGTYRAVYTLVGADGETSASPEVSFTIAAGNQPQLTFPALPTGYTSQNVYITAPSGASGSEVLYATGYTGTTATLTAAAPVSTVAPPTTAANTKYVSLLHHRNAIAIAMRPLPLPDVGGIKGTILYYRGIPMRITIDWLQSLLSATIVVDTLFGCAVVRPDFAIPIIA